MSGVAPDARLNELLSPRRREFKYSQHLHRAWLYAKRQVLLSHDAISQDARKKPDAGGI
jgi:hypothetical protein